MVNVKVPDNPVQKRGLWPPKGGREIPVLESDDWSTIAAREHLDVSALIDFNFHTHVPEEINWYLQELIGCRRSKDGRNYTFLGADPRSSKSTFLSRPRRPVPTTSASRSRLKSKRRSARGIRALTSPTGFSAPSARSGAPAVSFRRSSTPSTGSPSSMKSPPASRSAPQEITSTRASSCTSFRSFTTCTIARWKRGTTAAPGFQISGAIISQRPADQTTIR